MSQQPVILWFRHDLRLADHSPLDTAVCLRVPIIPVFIFDDRSEGDWPLGAATKWWLHQALQQLGNTLTELGSRLILRHGPTESVLAQLAEATGATDVFCHRRYEPAARAIETAVEKCLAQEGVRFQALAGTLLFEPADVRNKQGKPFQVFTPFWKHCQTLPKPAVPLRPPGQMMKPARWPESLTLTDLQLLPVIPWDSGFYDTWTPGEAGAQQRLAGLKKTISDYKIERNRPDREGTSRLSPHLHFGEISPRQVWHAIHGWIDNSQVEAANALTFLSEIGWREFSHHVLFHFPLTPKTALREDFRKFPWRYDAKQQRAWQRGLTGYPIVDAGMRQLWHTGWMHNRVRMVVGSFLTKHLQLSWLDGAKWFWDTLVDADLAQNTLNWQWVGGCGADAAPYFRVFNPTLQGNKFDPDGAYVRKWVPELTDCPTKWIHEPWNAPPEELKRHGITLGETYPAPIVDHFEARERALEALASIRKR